ncbi:MAG: hypothetical protein U0165_10770 [Polyangiaceae bacterium]
MMLSRSCLGSFAFGLVAVAALQGCTAHVRPATLDQAKAAAETPKSHDASELAPASFAEAEALRTSAEKAFADGDTASAAILAETAIAAYERAFAQARIVRAEKARDEARAGLDAVTTDLSKLEQEQARVNAELRDLETRIKVVLDAQPLYAISAANDPAREKARFEAARALSTEAHLLCVAARLLSVEAEGLADAEKSVTHLEHELGDSNAKNAPIDSALRARAACLKALTVARRNARAGAPISDQADALLSEVSKSSAFDPIRDDRGVVVSIPAPFSGENATKDAETRLSTLGKIAAAHKGMPLVAVVHAADEPKPGTPSDRDNKRGEAIKQILLREGATKVEVVLAGASRPIIDVKVPQDRIRNERLEVVFVSK